MLSALAQMVLEKHLLAPRLGMLVPMSVALLLPRG